MPRSRNRVSHRARDGVPCFAEAFGNGLGDVDVRSAAVNEKAFPFLDLCGVALYAYPERYPFVYEKISMRSLQSHHIRYICPPWF